MDNKDNRKRILSGLRVLDFTDAMAGPFCARYLADCGCEVINIEKPEGKVARSLPYFKDGFCAEYIENHAGKKSLAMDLKAPGARELILKMAKVSDIVVENFRPGVMADFGLAYEDFKAVNPKIIMCAMSGWGATGPWAEHMGVDLLVQASRGSAIMGSPPGQRPNFAAFAVSDILAGVNGFGAICAALYKREVTGEGEYIDVAMADCVFYSLGNAVGTHSLSKGKHELRYMVGSHSPDLSPDGAYKGKDGYVTIFTRTELAFERLCELMGKPELAKDPRFKDNAARCKYNDELTPIIDEWVSSFDHVADVAALLQSWRMLSAPVQSVRQVIEEDEQTKARDMIRVIKHPVLGDFNFLNSPLKFRNSKAEVTDPPPVDVGQHTNAVMKSVLKLSDAEIKKLKEEKILFGPDK
jgi:CoA:oxalate CoA-transferase